MGEEVNLHQAESQILQCWLGVWELINDVKQLLNPDLGDGVGVCCRGVPVAFSC